MSYTVKEFKLLFTPEELAELPALARQYLAALEKDGDSTEVDEGYFYMQVRDGEFIEAYDALYQGVYYQE